MVDREYWEPDQKEHPMVHFPEDLRGLPVGRFVKVRAWMDMAAFVVWGLQLMETQEEDEMGGRQKYRLELQGQRYFAVLEMTVRVYGN
jgi:hypothetical protein